MLIEHKRVFLFWFKDLVLHNDNVSYVIKWLADGEDKIHVIRDDHHQEIWKNISTSNFNISKYIFLSICILHFNDVYYLSRLVITIHVETLFCRRKKTCTVITKPHPSRSGFLKLKSILCFCLNKFQKSYCNIFLLSTTFV